MILNKKSFANTGYLYKSILNHYIDDEYIITCGLRTRCDDFYESYDKSLNFKIKEDVKNIKCIYVIGCPEDLNKILIENRYISFDFYHNQLLVDSISKKVCCGMDLDFLKNNIIH